MTIRRLNLTAAIAAFYGTVAILTFGHSAAHNYPRNLYEQMVCDEARAAGMEHLPSRCLGAASPKAMASVDGITAGALWPLYWAWKAFE